MAKENGKVKSKEVKKMIPVSTILENQQVLQKVYKIPLDGKKTYLLRKSLKPISNAVKDFNEDRDAFIKEKGSVDERGRVSIKPSETELYKEFVAYIEEAVKVEVPAPDPVFDENSFGDMKFTIEDLDQLEALGLLKQEG